MHRLSLSLALTLLTACAGLPILGQLIGPLVSVSVPAEIPFPEQMILQLGPGAGIAGLADKALGALGQGTLEQRLGAAVKNSGIPFRSLAAEAFRKQLEDARLFGKVTHGQGHVSLSLGVARWGLAYDPLSKRMLPVLDLEATLSAPGLGPVWKASRSARDLSGAILAQVSKLDVSQLALKPQGLGDVMGIVSTELSRQLVDDLRRNPPRVDR